MLLRKLWRYFVTRAYWARRFAELGSRSILYRPVLVANPEYMFIGRRTVIRDNARIEVVIRPAVECAPKLVIGNNVNIEQGVHIVCQSSLIIEDDVSITPYCVIVDTDHPYHDPDAQPKIGARLSDADRPVRIGRGSFIGAHSVILPGVDIGCGCVVGAGSVVTRSVSDFCVVSGIPAKVIKRFDTNTRVWATANE